MTRFTAIQPEDMDADPPPLAIRRHTDRCFFAVQELLQAPDGSLDGFVVEGHRIDADDVAEVRRDTDAPVCGMRDGS